MRVTIRGAGGLRKALEDFSAVLAECLQSGHAIPDGPPKPATWSPCNGCGVCCIATPCELAIDVVPGAQEGRPCPALVWRDGRSWCGLVLSPSTHSPDLALRVEVLAKAIRDQARGFVDQAYGETIREMLGDGRCDAGPDEDEGPDELLGMTAAEYRTRWP